MKITLKKIIWLAVIAAVLAGAFFFGGDYNKNTQIPSTEEVIKTEAEIPPETEKEPEIIPEEEKEEVKPTTEKKEEKEEQPREEKKTDELPITAFEIKENTCTLSINCSTVLNNMALLDKNKTEIIPQNGIMLDKITVTFNEGESVFNVLRREAKRNKVHLEFSNTPVYNSVYIEGIGNLYEFDCGELSGWTYKVNGVSPGYSSSEYIIKSGDKIEWLYTCDLGKDVGANVQITK